MQNYQISTEYVIEVKFTDEMEELLLDDSRPKTLIVKRPKESDGFFRLGDIAINDVGDATSALMVKATDEMILKPPVDYNLAWDGSAGSNVNTTAATASGSFWKPVAPIGYTCLGDVWQGDQQKPPLDLIRCVLNKFVDQAASTIPTWDNNDAASEREDDASVWMSEADEDSLAPATLLVVPSYGHDDLQIQALEAKPFSIPYAKLKPCYFQDEDKEGYGLNNANSKWKENTFEVFDYSNGNSSLVGFKHLGVSERLKTPYCLGTSVFGSSVIQSNIFVHDVASGGNLTKERFVKQRQGHVGSDITELIDGDFVFLFPCSPANDMRDYFQILREKADLANKDGLTLNAVVNVGEDLGQVAMLGDPKWKHPHFCNQNEEPDEKGGCSEVEECYFEVGGCKTYDLLPCAVDSECKGGFCSKEEGAEKGVCGKDLILYTKKARGDSVALPRAKEYGSFQDGDGKFVVKDEGKTIELRGNVWKAFGISHEVNSQSILEFDFRLVEEAEGLAICLDEDLNEDVEIKGAYRCFRLAGTQQFWSEVWKLTGPSSSDGEWRHLQVRIGSLIYGPDEEKKKSYIPWGAQLNYLAFVQDNDEDPKLGMSEFRNIHLYHDDTINPEVLDFIPPVVTDNSITIHVDNPNQKGSWMQSLHRLNPTDPERKPILVKPDGEEYSVDSSLTHFTRTFDGLSPGKQYSLEMYPSDLSVNQGVQDTVVTHCCCDCVSEQKSIIGDTSGRPVNMQTFQKDGHVTFKFTENSQCADAYAFTRAAVTEEFYGGEDDKKQKSSFTANYYYFAEQQCSTGAVGDVVAPGQTASDDLKVSQLIVGDSYRYCVRAVARYYSGESHSSDETCKFHKVRWQASFSGSVTTDPLDGGIPIEDVHVSWELMNLNQTIVIATGEDVTDKPGTFTIEFDQSHRSLDTNSKFPVRIRFAKTTVVGSETIKHQFLCKEGNLDCTDDGVIVYLKHLEFDTPVVTYDNSSIPVRGKVSVWEPDGCPVIGAKVCLKTKHAKYPDGLGACVETNNNGEYVLPATIGATVGVEVTYHEHNIAKAPENVMDYDKGFFVDVNERYERNDFIDMSRAWLHLEVAGGLCDHRLGTSFVEVKINGCEQWKMDLTQKFVRAQHEVPAHVLAIKVRSVVDDNDKSLTVLEEYFMPKTMTKIIDLLAAEKGQQEEEEATAKEGDDKSDMVTEDNAALSERK